MRWFLALAIILAVMPSFAVSAENAADWDIPNGHFYTQASGESGSGKGFPITNNGGIPFWSEYQRLGGASVLGYVASDRYEWDGYIVQATQRVILQWRADVGQVFFANVFDRMHDLGKDEWLRTARQVPAIADWSSDTGKPWNEVVANHLAVLDASPAIKAKYYSVTGDPVQMNGLPMSTIVDMGNCNVLRAQRVVIQEWKSDVPWASKGDVTVALGGDLTKESGIMPTAARTPSNGAQSAIGVTPVTSPVAGISDHDAMVTYANQIWAMWDKLVQVDTNLSNDLKAARDRNSGIGAIDRAVKGVEPLVSEANAMKAPNLPFAPAMLSEFQKGLTLYYEGLKQYNWGLVSQDSAITSAAAKQISECNEALQQALWEFKAGVEKQGLKYKDGKWQ